MVASSFGGRQSVTSESKDWYWLKDKEGYICIEECTYSKNLPGMWHVTTICLRTESTIKMNLQINGSMPWPNEFSRIAVPGENNSKVRPLSHLWVQHHDDRNWIEEITRTAIQCHWLRVGDEGANIRLMPIKHLQIVQRFAIGIWKGDFASCIHHSTTDEMQNKTYAVLAKNHYLIFNCGCYNISF